MKTFNLKEALSGKPVITRNGKTVTAFHQFDITNQFILYGVIDNNVSNWTANGRYCIGDGNDSIYDLFMVTDKITKWINIYKNDNGELRTNTFFDTKEEAQGYSSSNDYLTTTSVTF